MVITLGEQKAVRQFDIRPWSANRDGDCGAVDVVHAAARRHPAHCVVPLSLRSVPGAASALIVIAFEAGVLGLAVPLDQADATLIATADAAASWTRTQ